VKAATAVAVVVRSVEKEGALCGDVFGSEIAANLFSGSVGSGGMFLADGFIR
jgi:hypothetical protein